MARARDDEPRDQPAPAPVAQVDRHDVLTRILPEGGWPGLALGEVWAFRTIVHFLVWRQITSEFRQMALGPAWLVLRPLLSVIIYTIIFSRLANLPSDGLPYPLFTLSAVVLWTFFTSATQAAANSLVANQHLLSKVYFPRLIAPIAGLVGATVPFAISFVILLVAAVAWGFPPGWQLVFAPIYVLLTASLALALGVAAAPLVVRYRDVLQTLDYLLLGWMYATPVVYAIDGVIPEPYQALYRLNPMTSCVQGMRWAVFGVGDPPGAALLASSGIVLLALALSAAWFRRRERSIVDIL